MFGLFSFVADIFSGIASQILAQVNVIEDAITAPLKAMVSQVVAGAWKGDGANRFASEMGSDVIPMLASIMVVQTNYGNAFKKSQDRMQQAFQQAANVAQTLSDVFNGIF